MRLNLSNRMRSNLVIGATFAVALILSLLPVPHWAQQFRPDWPGLVLIYWCIAMPDRVGITTAWTVGLIQDVLYGALLGQYALAKTVMAFVIINFHLRIRAFPPWQQAIAALGILFIGSLVVIWVRSLTGKTGIDISYWTPNIVGAIIWPWIFVVLRDIRRRRRVV